MRAFVSQVAYLGRRSFRRTLRQPANLVFPVVFPLMLLAVNAGGLAPATQLPGFPTDSFVAFALAVPFIQGALFATTNAGTDLARDISTGFLDRLALTPMRGSALIGGQLAGNVLFGVVQAVIYLIVGIVIGVHIESGVAGMLVLLVFAFLVTVAFSGFGAYFALRTGSSEGVQGLFPILFVFLFISSMNMPRNLIEIDWFRTAATLNPVSYLIEAVRSLVIVGWDAEALALGFGVVLVLGTISLTLATTSLKLRLTRT